MTCGSDGGESENNFATDHDFSLRLESEFREFFGIRKDPPDGFT
jgi:hypothetical protein